MFARFNIILVLVSFILSASAFAAQENQPIPDPTQWVSINNMVELPGFRFGYGYSHANVGFYDFNAYIGLSPGLVTEARVSFSSYRQWDGEKVITDPSKLYVNVGLSGWTNQSSTVAYFDNQNLRVKRGNLDMSQWAYLSNECTSGGGKGVVEKGSVDELLAPMPCTEWWSNGQGGATIGNIKSILSSNGEYGEYESDWDGVIRQRFGAGGQWLVEFKDTTSAAVYAALGSMEIKSGAPVPEPSSLGLVGLAAVRLLLRRRR